MFNDCILYNAKKLERQLSKLIEEEFANIGFHHTYAYIMTVISHGGYVKTKDISLELSLDSSTVTRMVSKLEKDGLVKKGSEHSKVDISLTEKGRELIPSIVLAWDRYHKRCDQLLTSEGKQDLNKSLVEVTTKLDQSGS